MTETQHFMSRGVGNGFTSCLAKVNVSGFDFWTTLSGVNKDSPTTSDALISESLVNAMKLFWNYNGHSVDVDLGGIQTLTIDIEQGDFDSLSGGTAPFESKDRVCANNWDVDRVEDPEFGDRHISLRIDPIRMYNGLTDDEDNFVGYGMFAFATVLDPVFLATNQFEEFTFLSYVDETFDPSNETYEYSDAIDGMWFVAGAKGGDEPPTITGLTVDFLFAPSEVLTFTYRDFTFYTYPA